jgi:hypothetical protein
MASGRDPNRGWFINMMGWFSFLGLFATGVVGLIGGIVRSEVAGFAGALYLLIGGLAFGVVLALVLRRGPSD